MKNFEIKFKPKFEERKLEESIILKEIKSVVGIEGINTEEDIKKMQEFYPHLDIAKMSKDLGINRSRIYPVVSVLVCPTDRQKFFLKTIYNTPEGKNIRVSNIFKLLNMSASDVAPLKILEEIGFLNLGKKNGITVDEKNKEKLKMVHPDIESWSINPIKKEVIKEQKPVAKGVRIDQAFKIILKDLPNSIEETSDEEIKKLIENFNVGDYKRYGIHVPSHNSIKKIRQSLLAMFKEGKFRNQKNKLEKSS